MKGVTVRLIKDDDLVEVSEWFAARKWPIPPSGKTLPETGYVAESADGKLLSVAWLYVTNSDVGIVDWIATAPEAGAKGLISVIKLIGFIEAVSAGRCNVFMHFTPNDKLARFLKKKCGFKIAETGVNICTRRRPMEAQAHG